MARWAGGIAAQVEPGDRVVVATPNGYEQLLLCLAASRAGAVPVPVNAADAAATRSTTWSTTRGAALVIRAAVEVDGAEPLGRGGPGRARRRRRALLHVGHHRQAQGRRAHPPGPARRRGRRRRCWPAGAAPRRGGDRPADGPHHGLRRRCSGLAVRRHPGLLPAPASTRCRCSTPSSSAGPRSSSACPPCTGCCSRPAPRTATSRSVRVWVSGADAMPAELAARFKRMGATADAARSSGRSARRPSPRATAWSRPAAASPSKLSPPLLGRRASARRSGMPLPGYRFKVVDDDGDEVAAGRRRRAAGQGARACSTGYHGDADGHRRRAHRRRLAAHRRPRPAGARSARVLFAGRKKDVIKHGGYSVYAVEVEQALEEHPDVLEAAVVGLPDERKGEVPAAAVRLRRRAHASTPDDLRGVGRRAAGRLQGARSASSPSTSCPAPAPTRSQKRASCVRAVRLSRPRRSADSVAGLEVDAWSRGAVGGVEVDVERRRPPYRVALEALAVGRGGERRVARRPRRRSLVGPPLATGSRVARPAAGPGTRTSPRSASSPRCWRKMVAVLLGRTRPGRGSGPRVGDLVGQPLGVARPGTSSSPRRTLDAVASAAPWRPRTATRPTPRRHGATTSARRRGPDARDGAHGGAAIGRRRQAPA